MKKNILLILIIAFSLNAGINKKKYLIDKEYLPMDFKIVPEFVQYKKGVGAIVGIGEPNCFVIANRNIEVIRVNSLNSFETMSTFTGMPTSSVYSNNQKLVWGVRGRGFYTMDLETGKNSHIVISHDGDSEIRLTDVLDVEKGLFVIKQLTSGMDTERTYSKYFLYNCKEDTIIFTSNKFKGQYFSLSKNSLLFVEFLGGPNIKWYVTDLESKIKSENSLTKKLTELQICVDVYERAYNFEKRIMFGYCTSLNSLTGRTQFYLVRWDAEMADVKVDLLTIQIPEEYYLSRICRISPDAKWIKCTASPADDKKDITVFYHLDNKYPQGISLPVFGGTTDLENPGAFVNHTTLGPLYVEVDSDHDNVLLIYKLNDCLPIIAKKFQNLGK